MSRKIPVYTDSTSIIRDYVNIVIATFWLFEGYIVGGPPVPPGAPRARRPRLEFERMLVNSKY